LGSFGIVPSSAYYGFYYSETDTAVNLLNLGENEQLIKLEDSKGWFYEEYGDNSIYTSQIDENWYFWRLSY